jgi:glycosyltransferase involved in cell wall biosynthesis
MEQIDMDTGLTASSAPTDIHVPLHVSSRDGGQSLPSKIATLPVLHLINGQHYAGAERVQDLLAMQLPAQGFTVGFACLKPERFPLLRRCREAALHELGMRWRFDLRPAWRIARLVRRGGYRLIHAHTPRAAMIGRIAAERAGVSLIYHVHSPTSRDTTHRLRNWINTRVERWSIAGAARLITVSASLAEHMRRSGVAGDRLTVVPNGVPCIESLPEREPPVDDWTLGTVALFRPRKGTEMLLEAMARLREQGLSVKLRAVGTFETPGYEEQIKSLVKRLGVESHVEWTGYCRDVSAELARMDLFVLPSLFGEGLPMVVLEAMAAGVPVVATRVEGVPEAIRDGVDGVLAEPRDAASLADALRRVVVGAVDWQALRSCALERQRQQFSDRSMAAGVAAVYRDVLGITPTR